LLRWWIRRRRSPPRATSAKPDQGNREQRAAAAGHRTRGDHDPSNIVVDALACCERPEAAVLGVLQKQCAAAPHLAQHVIGPLEAAIDATIARAQPCEQWGS
jgi:hypothetical protein